jgi:hypothetical protein
MAGQAPRRRGGCGNSLGSAITASWALERDVSLLVKSWNVDFIVTTGDNNHERRSFHD